LGECAQVAGALQVDLGSVDARRDVDGEHQFDIDGDRLRRRRCGLKSKITTPANTAAALLKERKIIRPRS